MPTAYKRRKPSPTNTTVVAAGDGAVTTIDLAGSAIPIPLDAEDALLAAADRGWIDLRGQRSIFASGSAAGAQATFTAQIKAHKDAPAVALALTDGVVASGAHEILIDADSRAAFIRFLVAGTASPGVNMANLYFVTK
jgi:hypothetical protein